MKIRLSEKQIKEMITKCVKEYLKESLGAVTNGLIQLSQKIISDIKDGEITIKYKPEQLNKYQNYYIAQKPLIIQLVSRFENDKTICLQVTKDYADIIYVNDRLLLAKKSPESIIIHELTHIVNRNMSNDRLLAPEHPNQEIQKMLYLFQDTELQARLSQFFSVLRNYPKEALSQDIYSYRMLLLTPMKYYIDNFIVNGNETNIRDLVKSNQYYKQKRNNIDSNVQYNLTGFNLEQQRAKLLKYYNKKYNEYLGKAVKILGFFLQ